ncbi:MAG: hypothetical protein U9N49_04455, partial [Campylobacterota bacterium]|nr:hypothetical protein [Campylobacterota bacterium]
QKTTFSVYGKNLPSTTAFYVDECMDAQPLGGSFTRRDFSCTPSYKTGSHWGVVKDKSGGTELYNFDVNFQ